MAFGACSIINKLLQLSQVAADCGVWDPIQEVYLAFQRKVVEDIILT